MSVMGSHSVSPTCEPNAAVAIDYHIVRRVELLALIAVQEHLTAHAAQIDLVDGRGIAATTLQQQQQCLSWVALIGACGASNGQSMHSVLAAATCGTIWVECDGCRLHE